MGDSLCDGAFPLGDPVTSAISPISVEGYPLLP